MKNRFKKIGSLLAACAVLTSSFTISAFAGSEESAVDSTREYLLREDFSDFKNGVNGSTNNRIDQWRIEGGAKGGDDEAAPEHLAVEDFGEMQNALAMKNRVQILRGGRDWSEDKYIQPGETVVIEYDIYATSDAKFIFGIHSTSNTQTAEDAGGQSAFMYLKPSENDVENENVYIFNSQGRNDAGVKFDGVTFKKNEVNHVKAEYTVNSDISLHTTDTLVMTVTNSAGTSTGTLHPNYRNSDDIRTVTGIRGINFWKDDKTGNVYLDNLEVYKSHVLLEEDFSDFKNGVNGSTNNRIDQWRIEGGAKGGDDEAAPEHLAVEDFGEMQNALAMKNRVQILRGGRDWSEDKYIQPGETVVIEYDIYATSDAKFIFGIHSTSNTQTAEDAGGQSAFMYLKPSENEIDDENVYIFNTQGRNDTGVKFEGVTFKKNEVNHVKAEYTVNGDISLHTTDTLVMTVTNSAGTSTGTLRPNYRNSDDIRTVTGIRGINFWKDDKTGNIYLDNLKVYRTNVTYTAPTAESKAADSVTVNFGKAVNSVADGKIYIFSNGAKVEATGALSDDKTSYTLSGASLTAGKEYQVVVANGLVAADGSLVKASKLTFVPANGTTTVTKDQTTIDPTADLNVSITAATDKVGKGVIVCVASYEEGGKLAGVKMQKATLTAATKTVTFTKDTITEANSYKIFVWDAVSGEPICNNL